MPDPADIERKITDRTKALVIINPNNPTGAVYDRELLVELTEIARRHGLLIYAFGITDDRQFVLDLLRAEKIMIVHGTGFNWPEPDHIRIVTLPHKDQLEDALTRIATFLDSYRQRS